MMHTIYSYTLLSRSGIAGLFYSGCSRLIAERSGLGIG